MRLSRDELLRLSRARPDELDALEAQRMIVPASTSYFFWRGPRWYTQAHLDVLRRYAAGRRAVEANRRLHPAAGRVPGS